MTGSTAHSARHVQPQGESSPLDAEVRAEIDFWIERFPADQKRSAVLGALRAVQHHNGGYLTTALMDAVADYLDLPQIAVYEVGTFYSMFELEPVGRHSVSVCTNVSCMLNGGDELLSGVEQHLGIQVGETTPDGRIFLKREEECLAACAGAPMMQVDHRYYEHLTPERAVEILDALE